MNLHIHLRFGGPMSRTASLLFAFAVCVAVHAAPTAPDLRDSKVNIPWSEFRGIIDLIAHPDTPSVPVTPLANEEYLLTSARVRGVVNGDRAAQFDVRLGIRVLPSLRLKADGWVRIALGAVPGGATSAVLQGVACAGRSLPVMQEDGAYGVLLSVAGTYDLTLSYYCPVADEQGVRRMALALPRAAATLCEISIPQTRAEVTINGVKQDAQTGSFGTRLTTPVVHDGSLSIEYSPIGEETIGASGIQMKPNVFAVTGLLADIKENQISYQFRVDFEIWHQKIQRFSILMPDTLPIERIEGAGIADWRVERRGDSVVCVVTTNFAPEKGYSLTMHFSQRLESANGVVRVPALRVLRVERESGFLAVRAAQTMEVLAGDSTIGLSPAGPDELPAWLQSSTDVLMRFKYTHPPYGLVLDVRRHQEMSVLVAIADEAGVQALFTRQGYVLTKYTYMIRNNHKQYMRVVMPESWQLWSVLIDGAAAMPAAGAKPGEVLIPLKKMSRVDEGQVFSLELVYWHESAKMGLFGRVKLATPLVDINCQQITGEVWVPRKYDYNGFKGSLRKVPDYQTRYLSKARGSSYGDVLSNMPIQSRFASNVYAKKQDVSTQALSLPVEIDVPEKGTCFRFEKKLTVAGEGSELSFGYGIRLPVLAQIWGWCIWLAAFAVGFLALRAVVRATGILPRLKWIAAGFFAVISLSIVSAIWSWNAPGIFWPAVFGVICAGLGMLASVSRSKTVAAVLLAMYAWIGMGDARAQNPDPTDLGASTVSVPWSDFKEILARIKRPVWHDTVTPPPPSSYVVTSVELDGERTSASRATFSARMRIVVLEPKQFVSVALPRGIALIPDVMVDGKPLSAGATESGENIISLRGAATYDVRYSFDAPLTEVDGRATVVFPLPGQTMAVLRLKLDGPGYLATANGRRMAPRSGGGRTVYEGGVGASTSVTIAWQQEVSNLGSQAAMVLGTAASRYSIGMGVVGLQSDISLTVLHQDISHFSFTLPASAEVIDLTGASVAAWDAVDSVDVRTVHVFFKYRVRDRTTFSLNAQMNCPDSAARVTLPAIEMRGVNRQEGFAGVGVISNVELTPSDQSSNVVRKDKRELPEFFGNAGDILYAYQYLSAPYRIEVALEPHRNVPSLDALVDSMYISSVMADDGKLITRMELTVKNRGEQFLHLSWNTRNQVWSLFCNDKPARPAFDSVAHEMLVPLDKSADRTAITRVTLVYLAQSAGVLPIGWRTIDYPAARIPAKNAEVTVYMPENVEPFWFGGNFEAQEEGRGVRPWIGSVFDGLMAPMGVGTHQVDFMERSEPMSVAVSEPQLAAESPPPPRARLSKAEVMHSKKTGSGGRVAGGARPATMAMVAQDQDREAEQLLDERQAADVLEAVQQAAPAALRTASLESGLLSIPVNISYEGTPRSFSSLLLKDSEAPSIFFCYRTVPSSVHWLNKLLIQLCLIIAAAFVTVGLWAGWSRRLVLYGIALPMTVALAVSRLVGYTMPVDLLVVIPIGFYLYKSFGAVVAWLKANTPGLRGRRSLREIEAEIDQEAKSDAAPTPVVTPSEDNAK
jgi:hypothetical protein